MQDFGSEEVEYMRLGDIATFQYGYTESAKDSGDCRFVRITDINSIGLVSDSDAKYVVFSSDLDKYRLFKNDILVARTGSYGRTTIFEGDYLAIFASYLIRISLNKELVLPKYYWLFAQTKDYWDQAGKLVKGTNQPQFNANAVCDIEIPIPSLETQQQLVDDIEEQIAYIKQTESVIAKQQEKIQAIIVKLWRENSDTLVDIDKALPNSFDLLLEKAVQPFQPKK